MAKNFKIFRENEYSRIALINDGIHVLKKDSDEVSPLSVTFDDKLHIALGWDMETYREVLCMSRAPFVFIKWRESKDKQKSYFNILRLAAGPVVNTVVGYMLCKNGIISGIAADDHLLENQPYLKCCKLPSLLTDIPDTGNVLETAFRKIQEMFSGAEIRSHVQTEYTMEICFTLERMPVKLGFTRIEEQQKYVISGFQLDE
ncbi:MAG: hypothetical protein IJ642_11285 [Oscillospiraceae bacterium]|nr:hypothetical protein [Oscillospiraceae bacterium]